MTARKTPTAVITTGVGSRRRTLDDHAARLARAGVARRHLGHEVVGQLVHDHRLVEYVVDVAGPDRPRAGDGQRAGAVGGDRHVAAVTEVVRAGGVIAVH